jgi:hypothetical protein
VAYDGSMRCLGLACLALVACTGCGRDRFDPLVDARSDGDSDATPDAADSSLIVDFKFEGSLTDSASGITATCLGGNCPTFAAGKHGQGVAFDGVAQCLQFDAPGKLESAAFTIALWVDQTADARYSMFAKPYNAASSDNDSWQIEADLAHQLSFTTVNNDTHDYQYITASTPGAWLHIAATWDGSLKRIYTNGVLAGSLADNPINFDATPPLIGCDINFGMLLYPFQGVIDDVVYYNRVLDDAEVLALAQ